jgi:hypothetical protein
LLRGLTRDPAMAIMCVHGLPAWYAARRESRLQTALVYVAGVRRQRPVWLGVCGRHLGSGASPDLGE